MDINIEEIMKKVREEVKRNKEKSNMLKNSENSYVSEFQIDFNRALLNIENAQQYSNIGIEVPQFPGFKGFKRKVARKVAKVLLYFLKIITNPQRMYNQQIIESLKDIMTIMEQLNKKIDMVKNEINKNNEGIAKRIINKKNNQY